MRWASIYSRTLRLFVNMVRVFDTAKNRKRVKPSTILLVDGHCYFITEHRSCLFYLRPVLVGDRFARPLVVTIWYHVLTRPLNRIMPSRRLFSLSGMAFVSNYTLYHVIFRARFIVSLRLSFCPGLGWERFWVVTLKRRYINSIDR